MMVGTVDPDRLLRAALQAWRPPPRLSLSAWADEHFYLSAESAAEPGRWRTLPYQRGFMDAITDPAIEHVTWMKSARIGYTKCINATVGYYMHQDPCPIMVVQPTIEDAQGYSKEEIAPMLRDCAALAQIVPESKSRDADNTILLKRFPGGSLSVVGANSGRGFRRVSRKVVIFDETDGYPPSAGTEGDQIQLGIRRTESYWDRKIIDGSTPGVGGASRIERLFFEGDQRRYYVPCPHCGFMQVLEFHRFSWPKDQPHLAVYVCVECGAEIEHSQKRAMVSAGEWRPGPHPQFPDDPAPAPFHGHASFHLWAAYSFSPNATWGQLCSEFVAAKKAGPEHIKTFINTVLGEPLQDRGDGVETNSLLLRREPYMDDVPAGACCLTMGVDTQDDRLEALVIGWGPGEESWLVHRETLPGDTSQPGPWRLLDELLDRLFRHESGTDLRVQAACIDSAGHRTTLVYDYAEKKAARRVYATIGRGGQHPIVSSPSPRKWGRAERQVPLYTVGVDAAKALFVSRLKLTEIGAGYVHLPTTDWCDEELAAQLTSERLVEKWHRGLPTRVWKKFRARNEMLDCAVLATAALRLLNPNFTAMSAALAVAPKPHPDLPPGHRPPPPRQRAFRSNYLSR